MDWESRNDPACEVHDHTNASLPLRAHRGTKIRNDLEGGFAVWQKRCVSGSKRLGYGSMVAPCVEPEWIR
jgi:hypothetical protein